MPNSSTTPETLSERVNDLYWNSSSTVDEIVEELGISRNSLYSSVRPTPAGASCPDCGERLVYTNRSNRSSNVATCTGCSAGVEIDRAQRDDPYRRSPARPTPEVGMGDRFDLDTEEANWRRWRRDLSHVEPERVALIGGAAALGVVVGAAAVRAVRQMR